MTFCRVIMMLALCESRIRCVHAWNCSQSGDCTSGEKSDRVSNVCFNYYCVMLHCQDTLKQVCQCVCQKPSIFIENKEHLVYFNVVYTWPNVHITISQCMAYTRSSPWTNRLRFATCHLAF